MKTNDRSQLTPWNSQDKAQFQEWWTSIEPSLKRSAARMVSDLASDLVQDVGILAIRNWGKFDSYEDFAPWCQIRTRWLALDELSRRKRLHSFEPSIDPDQLAVPSTAIPAFEELIPLIDQLPSQQRQVVLCKLMGYSSQEVAESMDITPSSVRSHWRHAQNNLANQIDLN